MADYPGTTFTPTTKNTGDTIAAAHVNALQAEVTAIEAALLTSGLAHHLLFVDATYDIGASGATRPRNLYLSGKLDVQGGDIWETTSNANYYLHIDTNFDANDTINFAGPLGVVFLQFDFDNGGIAAGNVTTVGVTGKTVLINGVMNLADYTAPTWVVGDRYLVANAAGVVHLSAVGPAS